MNHFLNIARNDLRNAFRDQVMIIFCLLPVLMIIVIKWLFPLMATYFPVISPYKPEFLAMITMVGAMGPAFLISLVMLDEKDENITHALRVVPFSSTKFMLSRVIFITLMSFAGSFLIILFSGIEIIFLNRIIIISVEIALVSPLITLACVSIARNKIEGITLMKGLNFLLAIPFIIILLQPSWESSGGIIPFYWIYKGFQVIQENTYDFFIYSFTGIIYMAGVIFILFRLKQQKDKKYL